MDAAQAILTSTGGPTSHAAVVARGWGKPCIVGAGEVAINYGKNEFIVNGPGYAAGTGSPSMEPAARSSLARLH